MKIREKKEDLVLKGVDAELKVVGKSHYEENKGEKYNHTCSVVIFSVGH